MGFLLYWAVLTKILNIRNIRIIFQLGTNTLIHILFGSRFASNRNDDQKILSKTLKRNLNNDLLKYMRSFRLSFACEIYAYEKQSFIHKHGLEHGHTNGILIWKFWCENSHIQRINKGKQRKKDETCKMFLLLYTAHWLILCWNSIDLNWIEWNPLFRWIIIILIRNCFYHVFFFQFVYFSKTHFILIWKHENRNRLWGVIEYGTL